MGCDIHMYVEYKKTVNDKEKWVNGDYFKHNPYFNEFDGEGQYSQLELHGNRNYQLFATLAGVRDYTEKVNPVAEPRGIPEDASDYVKEENKSWDSDGHSHSWLTLKELKEYQAENPTMHYTGLLDPETLKEFDEKGTIPNIWCQGTNQPGYERREWSTENKSLVPLIEKLQNRAHELLQYEWEEYKIENDEKVRIVFWFDN